MNYFIAGLLIGLVGCLIVNKCWSKLYEETVEDWIEICQAILQDKAKIHPVVMKYSKKDDEP